MKIIAVMVTYFPNKVDIEGVFSTLLHQVDELIVVDNTPGGGLFDNAEGKYSLIKLGENVGIAKAQNIGINLALSHNADILVLSDQDTYYPDNYISNMTTGIFGRDSKVAAIVPNFADSNRNNEKQGFIVFNGFFIKRIYPEHGYYEITQGISSGQIISSAALKNIGLMDDRLFIDWVDLEWCWRARSKGYKIIGCADVSVNHTLGDFSMRVGRNRYPIRSPIRHYYIVRNAMYLALNSEAISFGMRINLFFKAFAYIVGFSFLGRPRVKHLKFCITGLIHGTFSKLGEYK